MIIISSLELVHGGGPRHHTASRIKTYLKSRNVVIFVIFDLPAWHQPRFVLERRRFLRQCHVIHFRIRWQFHGKNNTRHLFESLPREYFWYFPRNMICKEHEGRKIQVLGMLYGFALENGYFFYIWSETARSKLTQFLNLQLPLPRGMFFL